MEESRKMIISIPELEKARKMFFLLAETKLQIETAYDTYKSPDFTAVRSTKSSRDQSDQMIKTITKIEKLKEYRDILLVQFFEYQFHVMDKIPDTTVRALVMGYYFAGLDWKDCRFPGSRCSKRRMIEYIENHYEELNG